MSVFFTSGTYFRRLYSLNSAWHHPYAMSNTGVLTEQMALRLRGNGTLNNGTLTGRIWHII